MKSAELSTVLVGLSESPSEEPLPLPQARDICLAPFLAGLEPPPKLELSEWADLYRFLPDTAPEPGQWRTSRAPYLRKIMDALSAHAPYDRVVFMKGTQLGATEVGNNWLGYTIHHAPATMLYLEPSDASAKKISKQRIEPMLRDTDVLRPLITGGENQPGRKETILEKYWPGGSLTLASAKSTSALRMISCQNLFADEVDEYDKDVNHQGSPLDLAEKRLDAFAGRSKVYIPSTPTLAESSVIEDEYKRTDQQVYEVPCPHCGTFQLITFHGHIRWDDDAHPELAYMQCEACGLHIEESQKDDILAAGRWVPTAVGAPGTIGFWLPSTYSPWFTWGKAVRQFLKAKGDPHAMKVFTNTVLAETFQDALTSIDDDELLGRVETFPAEVPRGVLVLTAGVDTQEDRLEMEVVGWGLGWESWGIEYRRFYGDPDQPQVWADLMDALDRMRQHEDGYTLPIAAACIDSRGHHTQAVYEFCQGKEVRRIFAIAGVPDNGKRALTGAPTKKRTGRGERHCLLFDVCTAIARAHVYGRLAIKKATGDMDGDVPASTPGYTHFRADGRGYDEEYFRQLNSMHVKEFPFRGRTKREWSIKKGRRKEALDCRCYSLAALNILQPDWEPLVKRRKRQAEDAPKAREAATLAQATAVSATPQPPRRQVRRPGRGNWVTGW